jgi:hypothetical protein
MSITIQEAIKATDENKEVKCLADGCVYTKENISSSFSRYQIESEWEIFEQEERPKPCIWCDGHTRIVQFSNFDKYKELVYFKVICNDKYIHECDASSPSNIIKQEAIRKHNELYDRLHQNYKDED